jgi:hypothetical protein
MIISKNTLVQIILFKSVDPYVYLYIEIGTVFDASGECVMFYCDVRYAIDYFDTHFVVVFQTMFNSPEKMDAMRIAFWLQI